MIPGRKENPHGKIQDDTRRRKTPEEKKFRMMPGGGFLYVEQVKIYVKENL